MHMKCKSSTDGRKVTSHEKAALRLRVVQRMRDGDSSDELARILAINPRTIYRWLERFHYGGESAPQNKPK
jgi:transposase